MIYWRLGSSETSDRPGKALNSLSERRIQNDSRSFHLVNRETDHQWVNPSDSLSEMAMGVFMPEELKLLCRMRFSNSRN
jgi:hypothetical protein